MEQDASPAEAAAEGPEAEGLEGLEGPGADASAGHRDEAAQGGEGEAAVLAAMTAADPEAAAALQAEWGADFGGRIELARRGARALATPELVALLEDSGLGDHPALIRAAAEIGRHLAEPDPGAAPGPDAAATPEGLDAAELERLESEIDRLHGLQASQPQAYRSERTQRSLARLYARRYGRGPLVGEGQRRL